MSTSPLQIQDIRAYYDNSGEYHYFGPDYRRAAPILIEFKKAYPSLEEHHLHELTAILAKRPVDSDHIVAADLLYMYRPIPAVLFEPMIDCAIDYRDPSFNRIFLRPCMKAFGDKAVAEMLHKKFLEGEIIRRIGVASLLYWFWWKNKEDVQVLYETIIAQGNQSDNLVEKYIYNLYVGIESDFPLPKNADELKRMVRDNEKCCQLLRDLNWRMGE
ncbi:hypothetical protein HHL17_22250 [Chitinophaga sp. G-6-1-13]|uniref:Uncharacterized protein n=1 Tax=Chitinophaga fulva TaxID=2728842 RepID=A0A848GRF1_9BACT|nr:hypothetical protein [Chitinophaga fulva]NML39939.1 hypothetical protein [Chitinophaga fulva]